MDKWSQLPGTLKVPGWYHVHRLELAGDCDSILEDPNCTVTGGLNSGLAYPGSQVGRYTRFSEWKGSTFGCQSLKKCLFSEWVAYSTRTKNWNGKKKNQTLSSFMQGSRHQQVAPSCLADRGWGGLGPVSCWTLFSLLLSPLGRLLHVQNLQLEQSGSGVSPSKPSTQTQLHSHCLGCQLPTGLQYCIHSLMQG